MKIAPIFGLVLLMSLSVLAEDQGSRPEAQITFQIETDEHQPVAGAEVRMGTFDHNVPGESFGTDVSANTSGTTDDNGSVTLSMPSLDGKFGYGATKSGYYKSLGDYYEFKAPIDNKWQPWNPTVGVILKPIINPIPMYARKVGDVTAPLTIPVFGKPIGFDLLDADWIAPYGKGNVADLIFTFTEVVPYVTVQKAFDIKLTVSFSGIEDGIQAIKAPVNRGSELRLPRYAPQDGYQSTLVKEIKRRGEGQPLDSGTQEDQNYFFRVRTVTDNNGKIKSALYGKIDGDILFWGNRRLRFCYYLNPIPNDRNMEFDPNKNLFRRLSFFDQIRTP